MSLLMSLVTAGLGVLMVLLLVFGIVSGRIGLLRWRDRFTTAVHLLERGEDARALYLFKKSFMLPASFQPGLIGGAGKMSNDDILQHDTSIVAHLQTIYARHGVPFQGDSLLALLQQFSAAYGNTDAADLAAQQKSGDWPKLGADRAAAKRSEERSEAVADLKATFQRAIDALPDLDDEA